MIKIYPSALEGEPLEIHSVDRPYKLRDWLESMVKGYEHDVAAHNLTIVVDGTVVESSEWATQIIHSGSDVEIRYQPKGGGIKGIAVAAFALFLLPFALLSALKPSIPNVKDRRQGTQIGATGIKANVAAFGDPIPEIAGSPKVYPIYLVPPRRFYQGRTSQWVEAFLCVGAGKYQKSEANVYVGNTPLVALGDDADIEFYEPGESLSGVTAAQWWHTPPEVGFTTFASSGLKLNNRTTLTPEWDASSFTFDGETITAPVAHPSNWTVGTILRVTAAYQVLFTSGATRDTLSSIGAFQTYQPGVGDVIEIDGVNSGTYVIHSFVSGTPGVAGSPSSLNAVGNVVRLDYGATSAELTISTSTQSYYILLDTTVASVADLVTFINDRLVDAQVQAVQSGSQINITEVTPFSGQPINVTGSGVADVFGGVPTQTIGQRTIAGTPDSVTLNDEDGNPVRGLQQGVFDVAIGFDGLRYQIVNKISSTVLQVAQLDADGELVPSWDGFYPLTSSSSEVMVDRGSIEGNWCGPFQGNPEGRLVNAIEVDLFFPQGLVHYDDKGRNIKVSATVYVEWRENPADTWKTTAYSFRERSPDQMGFTYRINLPVASTVQVRVRRNKPSARKNTYQEIQWTGFRCLVDDYPLQYDGMTTLAVKLKTGDALSINAEDQIWLRPTRILPSIDTGIEAPTRSVADFFYHIMKSIGYPDSAINIDAIRELNQAWRIRKDTFDFAYASHTTVKEAANDVLAAGFSELTIANGLITPVRDIYQDQPRMMLSDQEFTKPLTVETVLFNPDEIDGVDAEYEDRATGQVKTVEFRLPFDAGNRVEKITLIGVSDYNKAFEIAARYRRAKAYRRTNFSGATEQHLRLIPYKTTVGILEKVPHYSQSAFVLAVENLGADKWILTVSEELLWPEGFASLGLRRANGELVGPFAATQGTEANQVIINKISNFSFNVGAGTEQATVVYFGDTQQLYHNAIITSVTPNQNGTFDFTAINNDYRVYLDDIEPYTFLTSKLYPIDVLDELTSSTGEIEIPPEVPPDNMESSAVLVSGYLRDPLIVYSNWGPEVLLSSAAIVSGTIIETIYIEYDNWLPESLEASATLVSGSLTQILITYDDWPAELLESSALIASGTLS